MRINSKFMLPVFFLNQIFKDIVKGISANLPDDLDSMRQSLDTVVVAVDTNEEILPETQVCFEANSHF